MSDRNEPSPVSRDVPGLAVGRIAGIPVRLDATYVAMAAAVLISLFFSRKLDVWQFVAVYVLVMAGLSASILMHELGHAVVARTYGLRAEEILIGGFFGLVLLSGEAARRSDAIKVLLAGSVANALLFAGLWLCLGAPGLTGSLYFDKPFIATGVAEHPVLRFSVQWLALANLGMLAFNLLPAFPLDGGRITRLVLGRYIDDAAAVRTTAILGIVVGLWSCIGIVLSSALVIVGPLLIYANFGFLTGRFEAPPD